VIFVLIFIQKIDFFVKINLSILGMIGKIDHVTAKNLSVPLGSWPQVDR